MVKKIPLVILSFSRYRSIWKNMSERWSRYEEEFDLYLITDWDEKKFPSIHSFLPTDSNINVVISNHSGWTEMLKDAVEQFLEKGINRVLFTFDDLFPKKIVSNDVKKAYESFIAHNLSSLRLAHSFQKNYISEGNLKIDNGNRKYLTTLVYCFWKLEDLKLILITTTNPWDFEVNGYKSAKNLKIASLKKEIVHYENLIVKGKKLPYLSKDYDFPKMGIVTYMKYSLKLFLIKIFKKLNIVNFYE